MRVLSKRLLTQRILQFIFTSSLFSTLYIEHSIFDFKVYTFILSKFWQCLLPLFLFFIKINDCDSDWIIVAMQLDRPHCTQGWLLIRERVGGRQGEWRRGEGLHLHNESTTSTATTKDLSLKERNEFHCFREAQSILHFLFSLWYFLFFALTVSPLFGTKLVFGISFTVT